MTFVSDHPITVDGVRLDTLAYGIEGAALTIGGLRSGDQILAGVDGAVASLEDAREPSIYALSMFVNGCDEDGLVPADRSKWGLLRQNLDMLLHLFARTDALLDVREVIYTDPVTPDVEAALEAPQRQAFAKVSDTLAPDLAPGAVARFTVALNFPDVYWQDPAPLTWAKAVEVVATNLVPNPDLVDSDGDGFADQWTGGFLDTANWTTTTDAGGMTATAVGVGTASGGPEALVTLDGPSGEDTIVVGMTFDGTTAATWRVHILCYDAGGTYLGSAATASGLNADGVEHTVSGTLLPGTADARLALYQSSDTVAGDTLRITAARAAYGTAFSTGPFSGDTASDGTYGYRWTGPVNGSASEKYLLSSGPATGVAYPVDTLDDSTAPISDAVVCVTGPATSPVQVADANTGAFVRLNANVPAGQTWRVNAATWESRMGAGLNPDSLDSAGADMAAVTDSGGRYPSLLRFTPRPDNGTRRVKVSLTAAGLTDDSELTVTARRKFL